MTPGWRSSSSEQDLGTQRASRSDSSILSPLLHISDYNIFASTDIYRYCVCVLDLHPDPGINLCKRIYFLEESIINFPVSVISNFIAL